MQIQMNNINYSERRNSMEIIIFLIVMFVLLIIGTHIGVALGASALVILILFQETSMDIIAQQTFQSANSYSLAAIPFFILAGDIIMKGNLAEKLLNFTDTITRKIYGGTAIAAMLVSVFFSAVSGSSVASAAAIGKNLVEIMGEKGYPKRFIAGLVATGGTIGLLIPPSLSFILIGSLIGIPIIDLFTAGIIPGIMQATILIALTWWLCRKNKWEPNSDITTIKKGLPMKQLKSSSGVLLLPVLILGGIYLGFFTPTEVSAVAVVYAAILAVLVYRAIKIKDLWQVSRGALLQSGMIYLILIGGALTAFMLKSLGLTNGIITMITDLGLHPWQFLIIVNVLLLFLGLFLDGITVIALVAPILFPVAVAAGIDPIHFAVIITMNIEIATLTPPVGLNLFVMSGLTKLPIQEVAKGVGPYYVVMIVSLLLVTYFPAISTWLVNL
jgi:C4-dicarboxylate transporter, DctM subunit